MKKIEYINTHERLAQIEANVQWLTKLVIIDLTLTGSILVMLLGKVLVTG